MPTPIRRGGTTNVTTNTTTVDKPAVNKPKPKKPANKPASTTFTPSSGTTTTRTTGVTTGTPVPPNSLLGLIGSAKDRLYVHLDSVDSPDVQKALVDASKRGVDVHVVLTPSKKIDPAGTLNILRLTDDGIDLAVKKSTTLPEGVGVSDKTGFTLPKPDPVTGSGSAKTTTTAADVNKSVAAFEGELAVKLSGSATAKLLPPNQVKLHEMPMETSQPILNAINAAKTSIDLEVYQVGDRGVIDALSAAAKRGVKVRVMLEPKTVGASNFDKVSKELKAAGVDVQPTPPQFDIHHNVDHAKFMVVDNKELLFGTGNLVRYGLGGNELDEANSRDFWAEDTRTDSVADGVKLFAADWARQPTQSSDFKSLVVTPDNAKSKVFDTIDNAKKQLYVYNQSLDDPDTMKHLLDAKKRGVDVKVLLGDQPIPHMGPKNAPAVKQLKAAGIDVEYLTKSYLHAKGIFSESQAFFGSQNFTGGGLGNNREVGEVFQDKQVISDAQKQFLADFAAPGDQPH